jgi:hypothetical protein
LVLYEPNILLQPEKPENAEDSVKVSEG